MATVQEVPCPPTPPAIAHELPSVDKVSEHASSRPRRDVGGINERLSGDPSLGLREMHRTQ